KGVARVLRLGGELVARDVNGLDLRLRRQLLAFEAVNANDGVGPRQLGELPLQLVGIVRERVNLIGGELQAELGRSPVCRRFLRVVADDDGRLELRQDQYDGELVVDAGTRARVAKHTGIE